MIPVYEREPWCLHLTSSPRQILEPLSLPGLPMVLQLALLMCVCVCS